MVYFNLFKMILMGRYGEIYAYFDVCYGWVDGGMVKRKDCDTIIQELQLEEDELKTLVTSYSAIYFHLVNICRVSDCGLLWSHWEAWIYTERKPYLSPQ